MPRRLRGHHIPRLRSDIAPPASSGRASCWMGRPSFTPSLHCHRCPPAPFWSHCSPGGLLSPFWRHAIRVRPVGGAAFLPHRRPSTRHGDRSLPGGGGPWIKRLCGSRATPEAIGRTLGDKLGSTPRRSGSGLPQSLMSPCRRGRGHAAWAITGQNPWTRLSGRHDMLSLTAEQQGDGHRSLDDNVRRYSCDLGSPGR
jgi:hypothetical protein